MSRYKNIDTEFVINFIQDCANNGKTTPEEICEESLYRISEIDKQFRLKLKYMGVLDFFKHKKRTKTEQEEIVFSEINRKVSMSILDYIYEENGFIHTDKLLNKFVGLDLDCVQEFIYTTKQMLEMKILLRNKDSVITYGDNYKQFSERK